MHLSITVGVVQHVSDLLRCCYSVCVSRLYRPFHRQRIRAPMMRDRRHVLPDANFDGPALLDEQTQMLSDAPPADINSLLFLKLRLSAQQRATAQRNYWQRAQPEGEGMPGGATHAVGRSNAASSKTSNAAPNGDTESYPAVSNWNVQPTPVRTSVAASAACPNSVPQSSVRNESVYEHVPLTPGARASLDDTSAAPRPQQLPVGSHQTPFEDMPASAAKRAMSSAPSASESSLPSHSEIRPAAVDEKPATASGTPKLPAGADDMRDVPLVPCPHCGRTFAPDRLERHAITCERQQITHPKPKTDGKDRKVSISSVGSSGKPERAAAATAAAASSGSVKTEKWRRQSAQLRSALAGTSAVEDDRVQCPHCGRRFAKDTAARHIPLCNAKEERHP
ncbi:hypothetical protein ABB37_04585 [Leptomonas pyrrhocoris]|uniref:C2HC/C3H-type domain-containing protein n=1 Tax=Leptomonas pyrrhocoris TaxID=157538 RepID=A0A0N0DVG0_LEPPY|nr:hypothetical protein ABB37_04585 [Leptomonas pyrrhocoris]KPA80298.1 hypothetical protein ABB37_04585 [Leptomonas pyrrhocoris]|eukprot:XP_015658737.1 hypothetical protein ABB37_04585 [Leptomonas pyrrhocoris]